jgi:hypothetical protein
MAVRVATHAKSRDFNNYLMKIRKQAEFLKEG